MLQGRPYVQGAPTRRLSARPTWDGQKFPDWMLLSGIKACISLEAQLRKAVPPEKTLCPFPGNPLPPTWECPLPLPSHQPPSTRE